MMRFILTAVLSLVGIIGSAASAPAAERSQAGAVVILADAGQRHGIGAGTVVAIAGDRLEIVTAKHVAVYGTLRVRLEDGTAVPARIEALIPDRDLAILEAEIPAAAVAGLRAAKLGVARSDEPVHVWGSGNDGPAFETGATANLFADLPDGAPHGRYSLACRLCHQGDSGAGVFDAHGTLVGVYIGFFTVGSSRISVAEFPVGAVEQALRVRPSDLALVAMPTDAAASDATR